MEEKTSRESLIQAEELKRKKAETLGQHIKNCTEAAKSVGIVVALILSMWANLTKASNDEVEKVSEKAQSKFDIVATDLETQHEQTEKIRETVEDTAKALRTVASASPAAAPSGIPVQDKEPDDRGCWTVYGGIVRCKGLGPTDAPEPVSNVVEVPEAPPPAPPPKAVTKERRSTRE